MKPHRFMSAFAGVVLVAGSLGVPSAALAQTALSLTGENFETGVVEIQASCSQTGTSTISYSATGEAVGPYLGTYTEVGTITVGQTPTGGFNLGLPFKQVTSLEAFFTIQSAAGEVTGSKRLVVQSNFVFGICEELTDYTPPGFPAPVDLTFHHVCACPDLSGAVPLSYEALIETETGLFRDEGQSGLTVGELTIGSQARQATFDEVFISSEIIEVSGVGKATGGGQLNGGVAFGFNAQSDGGLHGRCTVVDQAREIHVKCLDVTMYFQTATKAIFRGHALVNGAETMYRIVVEDNAESGAGADRFSISTDSGYGASGLLTAGNVQVHN